MRTFSQLQTEVLRYFDVADEPDGAADVELVKASLNNANANRCTEDNWKFMLSSPYSLAVVSGTQEYILPHSNFQKLQYLYSSTYKRFASSVAMSDVPYHDVAFNLTVQAETRYYDVIGFYPVKVQPTSATTLTLTSSAVDDAAATIYLEGEDSTGAQITESLEVGNTTTQSFAKVTYLAKTSEFEGTLTLATSGAVTLVTLSATENAKEFPVIRFTNVPQENETFQYRFYRRPRVMTRDNDVPDLPYPASNILVYDALLDLATYNELDSESVNIWRDKQSRWETVLYMNKLEADSVAGFNQHINAVGSI